MSFNIALSGINAAQKDLDTTANNISNVNTYGFKESRAEFADVYSASVFSNAATTVGQGVTTKAVAQQFRQGPLLPTDNSLDLAIEGRGFFATSAQINDLDVTLTRAGAFRRNSDGYVTNSSGQYLRAFPVNSDGSVSSVSLASSQPLQIPTSAGNPQATANVSLSMNLPASATGKVVANFDPSDNTTYTNATGLTIYDSLGQAYMATTYFVKDAAVPNRWAVFYTVTDDTGVLPVDVAGPGTITTAPGAPAVAQTGHYITFNPDGTVNQVNGGNPVVTETLGTSAGVDLDGASPSQTLTFSFSAPTQFAAPFEPKKLAQDGVTVGRLVKVDIASSGLVTATYSNDLISPLGKIALVSVNNEQGLAPTGATSWKTSSSSGEALAGEANQGSFGKILSGTLELSNVNLTSELVDLITAQRNFQANSRALEANNAITQSILQIR